MDLHALPKIELHLHLDCSLSFEAVRKLDPQVDERTYLQDYLVPAKCDDLMHYIDRVNRHIGKLTAAYSIINMNSIA